MKKTVYLDWNNFSKAYNFAEAGDSRLKDFIEEISSTHTLCLSFTHLLELTKGVVAVDPQNRQKAIEDTLKKAKWLDTLNIMWMQSFFLAEKEFAKKYLVETFTPNKFEIKILESSFIKTFHKWDVESFANTLRAVKNKGNTLVFAEQMISDIDKFKKQIVKYDSESIAGAKMLSVDRKQVRINRRQEQLKKSTEEKLKADILIILKAAHAELIETNLNAYRTKSGAIYLFPEPDFNVCIADIFRNKRKMELSFFKQQLMSNFADVVSYEDHTTAKFEKHSSSYGDLSHSYGAYLCDVFTCDKKMSRVVGEERVKVGKNKQLVLLSDVETFIKDMRNQLS